MPWSRVSQDLRFLWSLYWDASPEKRGEIKAFIVLMTAVLTAQTNLITQIAERKL